MNGSTEPETDRDQRCEHCKLYFSARGIKTHEETCQWQNFDQPHPEANVSPDPELEEGSDPSGSQNDPSSHSPDDTGAGITPDRVEPDGNESDIPDSGGAPSTATDGGPQTPPMPSIEPDQDRSVDDLADRFVPVDEYIASVRDRDPDHVDVDKLETLLSTYDVVDVEETTDQDIAAYEFEELSVDA
jgi:hypothetical protein